MDPRYSPPDSRIAEPIGPRRGIRPGAIALGTAVDVVGTLVFGVALIIVITIVLASGGLEPDQLEERLQSLATEVPMLVGVGLMGLAFTALGGYVAGRRAGCSELLHGALVGLASLVIGSAISPPGAPGVPMWVTWAALLLSIPAGALGGWLSARAAVPSSP